MVAYSFNRQFARPIREGIKKHTLRRPRKRHARAGEQLQLYVGMRTKQCFKIMDDPVCTGVSDIRLSFGDWDCRLFGEDRRLVTVDNAITEILVDGIPLELEEMQSLAVADGFLLNEGWTGLQALYAMSRFWTNAHGAKPWEGVMIKW